MFILSRERNNESGNKVVISHMQRSGTHQCYDRLQSADYVQTNKQTIRDILFLKEIQVVLPPYMLGGINILCLGKHCAAGNYCTYCNCFFFKFAEMH